MFLQRTKWVSSFSLAWTILDPFSIFIILFQLFWCCDLHNTILSSGTKIRQFLVDRALFRTGSIQDNWIHLNGYRQDSPHFLFRKIGQLCPVQETVTPKVPAGNFCNVSVLLSLQGSNDVLNWPMMKILRRRNLDHYTFLCQLPKTSVEHPSSFLSLLPPSQILQEIKGSHKVENSLCAEFSSDEVGTLLLTTLRQPQLQTIRSSIDGGHKDIQSCKNSLKFLLKREIQ